MAHPPNEQQLTAITEFATDLLVSAGAGTGKTTVLANKYLCLLAERRAAIREIVAITFTKKAAAEMRERIRQGVREQLSLAREPAEIEFWQQQLQLIEAARIATFHGLCLRLIQEHPLEAGIPPVSGVLDEGQERLYLMQAATAVLTAAVQTEETENEPLINWIRDYGWDALIDSLISIYQAIRESGRTIAAVIRQTQTALESGLEDALVGLTPLMYEVDELLAFCRSQKLTENATAVINSLREVWPGYREVLEQSRSFHELYPVLNDLGGGLPLTLPAALKERVVPIKEMLVEAQRRLADTEALARLPLLTMFLEDLQHRYRLLKQEGGVLDFADQQLLARQLLQEHPDIARQVQEGIGYLLVDEFQDTNSLQLDLVRLLLGEDYRGGRLMAVGDIKQSIYRFRGAEADLMTELAAEIAARDGRTVALTKNYRSNRTVIHFINALSERLFAGENFAYEPLEPGENDDGSRIEFLCCGETDSELQAQMLAERVAQMVSESAGAATPVRYGDIVLLFRAGTAMPVYQQALAALNIPYYTASGGDLYHRQEVVDQLNLLRIVQQRYDGIALLGLLASPYVGLTDEQLLRLSQVTDLVSAFYQDGGAVALVDDPAVAERFAAFRELILFLQERRELLPIPALIRMALERMHYREMMLGTVDAVQRLANLEKLIAKAEEFCGQGFHDLNRFLNYLQEMEGMEIGEGEAQTQAEGSDVVRLMTIHRSKGLEFPVVFLPDLDRNFRVGSGLKMVFHKEIGIGFKIPVAEDTPAETTIWRQIKERENRDELSELKRVLYVALTRAKRQLVLVGSGQSKSKGDTLATAKNWMKWFELLLPLAEAQTAMDFQGIPVAVARELEAVNVPSSPVTLLDEIAPAGADGGGATADNSEVAATAVLDPVLITLKVSGILAFKTCPRYYYWRYILRLDQGPETGRAVETEREAEPRGSQGAAIGNFIHQAVRLNSPAWPEELWQRSFGELAPTERERLKTDLERIWNHLRQSAYAGAQTQCWEEVPFVLKLNEWVRVEGRFDRLIRNAAGELILVDYKTHRIGRERMVQAAQGYFWQLQLYALAIAQIWGRLPDRAVLYFPYCDDEVRVPLDREALAQTGAETAAIAKFLAEHDRPDAFARGGDCHECKYRTVCR